MFAILAGMKKINLFLTEQQIAAMHALADQRGLGFAEMVRRLLDNALEQETFRQQRVREAPLTRRTP